MIGNLHVSQQKSEHLLNPSDFWEHYPSNNSIVTPLDLAYIKEYSQHISAPSIKIIVDNIIDGGVERSEVRSIIYSFMVIYLDDRDPQGGSTAIKELFLKGSREEKGVVQDFMGIAELSSEERKKSILNFENEVAHQNSD